MLLANNESFFEALERYCFAAYIRLLKWLVLE